MSTPLPEDYRAALGLEGEPTIETGLACAEDRLKHVLEQLEKMPEKNPARAKFKADRELLEPMVKELRASVHGVKVDELCDAAEDALAEKPTRRARARELLKQGRREGRALAADSDYLRRVQRLESKLEESPAGAASSAKDAGPNATVPPQKPPDAGSAQDSALAAPSHDVDDPGTGGATSTIPSGLVAGRTIGAGRFTLLRELGRGGMGVVWLAKDGLLKRDVALKLLPPEVAMDELALNDLRRETIESQRLSHPHIMRIHDLYQTPGEPAFISMEYVDGPNLRSLLGKQPQRCFTWDFLRPLLQQLASALDYAHSERVIHRDLKPSNLMLDSKGKLKLADFGIAATMSDSMSRVSQHTGKDTSGTLNYMSPQQMRGDNPSAADDIYSLGATFYELLTSRTPFYRGDIQYQVKHEIPQKPSERLASLGITNQVPERVSAMLLACLAKEPKDRPQSAVEMIEQMEGSTRFQSEHPSSPPASAPAVEPIPFAPAPEPQTLDAIAGVAPPTLPRTPGLPMLPKDEPPPTQKTTRLPASAPVPVPASSGGKSKWVLVAAVVILLGITLAYALRQNSKRDTTALLPTPPPVATSQLQITVQPAGAELFSNGVSLGRINTPLPLKGRPGSSVKLEARLDGYLSGVTNFDFPEAGASVDKTIVLRPMAAALYVSSEPPAEEIVLARQDNGKSETVPVSAKGIQLDPGIEYAVTVSIPDHETVRTNVPPLQPGQQYKLDLQQIPERTVTLRVSAETPGARFSIIYPERPAVNYGTNSVITGIAPRGKFAVVAEHKGFLPLTNDVALTPGEFVHTVEFGQLKPEYADLTVAASPRPFDLTVEWDGAEHGYGNTGKAMSLPAGRKLLITAKNDSGSATTNMTLRPGDNFLNLGSLAAETGYLLIKSEPDGANVSYKIDSQEMINLHQVSRIENLPLGRTVTVMLQKDGYWPKTLKKRMDRSGETLDFTRLVPLGGEIQTPRRPAVITASIKVYGPNDDAEIYVDKRPTGIKNGAVVSNLVAGRIYEIRLHRMGFEDLVAHVTMNADGTEKDMLFPAAPTAPRISEADLEAKVVEIYGKIEEVNKHIPFGEAYRREINDYIDRTTTLYGRKTAVWSRIKDPLQQLKDITNNRSNLARRE